MTLVEYWVSVLCCVILIPALIFMLWWILKMRWDAMDTVMLCVAIILAFFPFANIATMIFLIMVVCAAWLGKNIARLEHMDINARISGFINTKILRNEK